MTSKLVADLAHRLQYASRMTQNNTRPDFVKDQWELVAQTIELMIDQAIMESDMSRLASTVSAKHE